MRIGDHVFCCDPQDLIETQEDLKKQGINTKVCYVLEVTGGELVEHRCHKCPYVMCSNSSCEGCEVVDW